jgi:hypothetical protein
MAINWANPVGWNLVAGSLWFALSRRWIIFWETEISHIDYKIL